MRVAIKLQSADHVLVASDPVDVTSQRAYRKASSLYDDGQTLIKDNPTWKSDADKLRKEIESFFNALSHDKTSGELVDAIETFGEDSVEAGQVGWSSLKSEGRGLYRDAVNVILPRLVSLVKEIPVPRIEFKSAGEFDLDRQSSRPNPELMISRFLFFLYQTSTSLSMT